MKYFKNKNKIQIIKLNLFMKQYKKRLYNFIILFLKIKVFSCVQKHIIYKTISSIKSYN